MKERRWYYFLPLAGIIFGIWYIRIAFYDVVYSDYIRLVNNYLPDVWNPSKFLVPDILTRVPLSYLGRVVNTVFFHYSVTFDQILGVVGLGLSGMVLASYCIRRRIGAAWMLVLMAVVFSLNKWEMLTNGTGWVHFFAFAGFYYHYLVLDRVSGRPQKAFVASLAVDPVRSGAILRDIRCGTFSGVSVPAAPGAGRPKALGS